jgi:hypothetical protein
VPTATEQLALAHAKHHYYDALPPEAQFVEESPRASGVALACALIALSWTAIGLLIWSVA